ncbi:MAG: outer membrane lipoprotein chaperone LolA [Sulfuricaulis sp.]
MKRSRILGVMLLFCLNAAVAAESNTISGADSLRHFFNKVNSVKAQFSQVVVDESGNTIQESSGKLWIQRPNKFRWNYAKPYLQQIVADGKQIWVYDPGLQQVTVRPLAGSLDNTPAMLLAGKGRLDDNFIIKPLDAQDNLQWVQLIPRSQDSGYEDIRIGFAHDKMRALVMVDGFGHTTRVTLQDVQENTQIETSRFSFTPPAGVDVVGE